jgi:hypothetical protein
MANATVTLPLTPTDLGFFRARAPYTLAAGDRVPGELGGLVFGVFRRGVAAGSRWAYR